MIDDERKSQIKQEETYRREVQLQLKDKEVRKKSRLGKVILFFNSTLGAWVLSAIALSLVPFLYSLYNSHKATQERIYQLDVEAAIRLNQFRNRVNKVVMYKEITDALVDLAKPRSEDAAIMFPEFRERGLTALFVDLLTKVPEQEKPELQIAINAAQKLEYISVQHLVEMRRLSPDELANKAVDFKALEEIYKLANEDLTLKRWGKLSLPNVRLQ